MSEKKVHYPEEIYFCDPQKGGCGNVELEENLTEIQSKYPIRVCQMCGISLTGFRLKGAGTLITADNYCIIEDINMQLKALKLLVQALSIRNDKLKVLESLVEYLGGRDAEILKNSIELVTTALEPIIK